MARRAVRRLRAMSGRHLRWAIGAGGLVLGLGAEWVQANAGIGGERILIDFLVGQAYLLGGLFTWSREPANRTWRCMTAAGAGWYVGTFAALPISPIREAAVVLADLDAIFLIALVLVYPSGRFTSGLDRRVAIGAAIGLTASNVVLLLTNLPAIPLVVGLTVTAAMGVLVPRRWLRASPVQRRGLGPALVATGLTLLAIAIAIGTRLGRVTPEVESTLLAARDLALLGIPLGFVVGYFQLAADRYRRLVATQRATEEELRRSQARIVHAGDAARRRLERDLHDGAQQRLVAALIGLRVTRAEMAERSDPAQVAPLDTTIAELATSLAELRELAQGIHPVVLTEIGLGAALATLADRSPVPTTIARAPERRLDPTVEATAYYVVAEALTNVAKYAAATAAAVDASIDHGRLRIVVRDDGVGGAASRPGGGLAGLADRVRAVGGTLLVDSPRGSGTHITATIPLDPDQPPDEDAG